MFKQYFLIEMLRGTARLVLPDTGRQPDRVWAGEEVEEEEEKEEEELLL